VHQLQPVAASCSQLQPGASCSRAPVAASLATEASLFTTHFTARVTPTAPSKSPVLSHRGASYRLESGWSLGPSPPCRSYPTAAATSTPTRPLHAARAVAMAETWVHVLRWCTCGAAVQRAGCRRFFREIRTDAEIRTETEIRSERETGSGPGPVRVRLDTDGGRAAHRPNRRILASSSESESESANRGPPGVPPGRPRQAQGPGRGSDSAARTWSCRGGGEGVVGCVVIWFDQVG
jgi:hypothetical protein